MKRKVIITCAGNGASDPAKNPAVPITPEQIAKSSIDAAKAGAAIVHIHVRDPKTGQQSMDLALLGADFPELTPHALRHGFASMADDLGFTEPTIRAMLGHARSGVTSGYIHKVDSALVAAADEISEHIVALMNGEQKATADVVPMRRSARQA